MNKNRPLGLRPRNQRSAKAPQVPPAQGVAASLGMIKTLGLLKQPLLKTEYLKTFVPYFLGNLREWVHWFFHQLPGEKRVVDLIFFHSGVYRCKIHLQGIFPKAPIRDPVRCNDPKIRCVFAMVKSGVSHAASCTHHDHHDHRDHHVLIMIIMIIIIVVIIIIIITITISKLDAHCLLKFSVLTR